MKTVSTTVSQRPIEVFFAELMSKQMRYGVTRQTEASMKSTKVSHLVRTLHEGCIVPIIISTGTVNLP